MALPGPSISPRGGNLFETALSALVILVAVAFMVYFFDRVGTGHLGRYAMRVSLANASGLSVGTEVRVAGVKVGSVMDLSLDRGSYRAIVTIRIRDDLFLPVDSRASISSTPLGDVYLTLSPGHAARTVPPDGVLDAPKSPGPRRPIRPVAGASQS